MACGLDNHTGLRVLALYPKKRRLAVLQNLKRQKAIHKLVRAILLTSIVLVAGFLLLTPRNVGSDQLTSEEIQTRLSQFNDEVGLVNVNLNDQNELAKAYQSLNLPENDLTTLKMFVEQSLVRLTWITIWDDLAEDGDTIEITSSGYKTVVVLKNEPTTMAIPVGTQNITITGIKDGRIGGITAGIKTSSGEVFLPIMGEGQKIVLRIL